MMDELLQSPALPCNPCTSKASLSVTRMHVVSCHLLHYPDQALQRIQQKFMTLPSWFKFRVRARTELATLLTKA
jgi:hypothetical protein